MIECICSDGTVLDPWIIFKGKRQQPEWYGEHFLKGHICTSQRGWTDDELCLKWLKRCFELETAKKQKGEYRMLLFDGHGSHITFEVRQFCEEHKIILLCLPHHLTHLLQPLDVGVFGPFAYSYRMRVFKNKRWGTQGFVNKVDFLTYC
jgi:hypothetical protein